MGEAVLKRGERRVKMREVDLMRGDKVSQKRDELRTTPIASRPRWADGKLYLRRVAVLFD